MTDAELAAIEARYAAARSRGRWPSVDELTPLYLGDLPALIAALRELRAAARAAEVYAIGPAGPYCCMCGWYADRGHNASCPVGLLAALVGEGRDG